MAENRRHQYSYIDGNGRAVFVSESLKQMTDKLLTLAGQMTAAEMAAVKGCIYGMIVAVDKRNE